MNKKQYWENFYKKKHIKTPSSFARFCLNFIPYNANIIDFGSGNGRDTYFFNRVGNVTLGVDNAYIPDNEFFIKTNISKFLKEVDGTYDVVYTRFFLHAITNKEINALIKWSKGLFMAEFRAKEDIPILYPNHYRNKINGNKFLNKLIKNNFEILYYSKSRNVAKYKNENPLIIRVIARKDK